MVVASLVDSLSKIGAIGGIISFVGVGLMILLVAAQSRQIRAMREWIDAEPERQAETAQRVIAEVQRRIAAARERRAQQAAQVPGAPVVPGQPRQAPPAPGTLGATPEARAVAAAKAGDTTSGAATEILPEGASVAPPSPSADTPGGPPVFAPLTPAGAGGTGDDESAVGSDPEDDLGSPFDPGQDTQLSDTVPGEYDAGPSTPYAGGPDARFADDYGHYDDEHEEPAGNRVLFGVGAAALVAGIVIAAFVLFGGGGDDKTPVGGGTSAGQDASNGNGGNDSGGDSAKSTTPREIDRSTIRVTVLNGTKVNGRAAAITDTLDKQQYTTGQPNSLSGAATVATSMVEYRQGSNNQAKAKQVAEDLGLDPSAVQPIDASVSAAAPETADVVVLIGQDLAGSTSGTTG